VAARRAIDGTVFEAPGPGVYEARRGGDRQPIVVRLDDLLGAVQGENPQDEGQGQQSDDQNAQDRQQALETDLLDGQRRAS